MKNQLSKLILIAAAVILSVYFLWPTLNDFRFRQTLSGLSGPDSLSYLEQHQDDILEARLKRIKLGLDLQGGMRVLLEVDVLQLLEDLAKNKDDNFRAITSSIRGASATTEIDIIPALTVAFQQQNIRMSRYYLNIRDDDATVVSYLEDESIKAVDRAVEIVRNRVDQYGLTEPGIQKQGARRIIVELPGVKDEAEVRSLLQGTAKLEFLLVRDPDISYKVMESIDKFLAGTGERDTTRPAAAPQEKPSDALSELLGGPTATSDTTRDTEFLREHPFFTYVLPDQQGSGDGYVAEKNRDRVRSLLSRPEIRRLMPNDFEFRWSAKAFEDRSTGIRYYTLYPVRPQPVLTGGVIVNARASVDPQEGRPIVNMEMNSEGSREWSRLTGANVNKRVAVSLDNSIFSAPVIQEKITGGQSRIVGMDSPNEARLLEIVLKAGALPAPVAIIEQRSVGPSLGEDSIKSGLSAIGIAFGLTVLFMFLYYRTAGLVADLALFFNMLFILGVMAGFQATLTLPGLAGIILTIGLAVDANVLIYERMREELAGGKTIKAVVDAGYSKALSAIVDSNITTFLTGLILYQFGTGPIQGFALTLMIGIVASMFSAIVITRVIFDSMTDRGIIPNIG
ncbi:MAG: protein translocase subunit SecD [Bacteroidota bacterium]